MLSVQQKIVHMVYREGKAVGYFTRDDESGENIFFNTSKASLEDITDMINQAEKKV